MADETTALTTEPIEQTEQNLPVPQTGDFHLTPVVSLDSISHDLAEIKAFVKGQMVAKEDYGTVPGVDKPFLFKPGAEKLNNLYGLAPHYTELGCVENWETGLFAYKILCQLVHIKTGAIVSEGVGSCNSNEPKYRYLWKTREKKPSQAEGDRLKAQGVGRWRKYGGKWVFQDKTDNPDRAGLANTILKMAKKRAHVDATLTATRTSGIFSQDPEVIEGYDDAVDAEFYEVSMSDGGKTNEPHTDPPSDPDYTGGEAMGDMPDDTAGNRDDLIESTSPPDPKPATAYKVKQITALIDALPAEDEQERAAKVLALVQEAGIEVYTGPESVPQDRAGKLIDLLKANLAPEPKTESDGDDSVKCTDCGKTIKKTWKAYKYSMDKWGEPVCYDCGRDRLGV